MKKNLIQNLIFIVAFILYQILFWQKSLGLNVLIFSVLMIGALFYIHPDSRTSTAAKLTAIGTFVTAVCVVIFNSAFSKTIHAFSFITLVGFAQQRELRFLWYGLILSIWAMISTPIIAFERWARISSQTQWLNYSLRYARLSIMPIIVVFVFFGMYSLSNSKFGTVAFNTIESINNWFGSFLYNFTPEYFLFTILSFLILGGMLWKVKSDWLMPFQRAHKNTIERKRKKRRFSSMIALKNEYRSALILLGTLNLLTFLVNLTDFQNTWLGFASLDPYSISMDVHFGTYILIFTIVIAISLLMFYFRRNLNFYKKNKWLKIAAYTWIGQNIFLALSVALRNIKYIDFYGLTYKRMGVFIFLILVLYGLVTVIIKIKDRKTAYYLFQNNAWALYLVMVLFSAINWDVWMTSYNINHTKGSADYFYLFENMSDKNLALLHENPGSVYGRVDNYGDQYSILIANKTEEFNQKMKERSWLEWNYADHQTLLYLRKHHLAD